MRSTRPTTKPEFLVEDSRLRARSRDDTSLHQSRRPSWAPSLPDHPENPSPFVASPDEIEDDRVVQGAPLPLASKGRIPSESSLTTSIRHAEMGFTRSEAPSPEEQLSSPDDSGNFRKSLQIDMKGLVGDAVGNMSISPASRDIVLAARRGLFIIDLEAPLEVPRFLPQGGTWDVADVQWNPHPSRAEYIVSTSSEKLLIWNLLLAGKTSIEHILHSHYRAITDINWHTTERDTVVSTGIDSWLWGWDLREPKKPIFGLCAFNSAGTQVKWNRQDANLLASSHSGEVLIWDRRKGSLPIRQINAHSSRIYGIDWSHTASNEIVTCSLDKTIKVWDINDVEPTQSQSNCANRPQPRPKTTIHTTYPVWRARNLPFGEGVLSLAQRGETALEMYSTHEESKLPVEIFEGHTDVVKEFVWRKGEQETGEFQLITWSKDRTLRFWPVDSETMQKVGFIPPTSSRGRNRSRSSTDKEPTISFRNPPHGIEYLPQLSAPIGHRSILAEIRSGLPPTRQHNPFPHAPWAAPPTGAPHPLSATVTGPSSPSASRLTPTDRITAGGPVRPVRMATLKKGSGTMSRGSFAGKSMAGMDAFTWLSSVKVGEGRRDGSSGPGSGANSVDASRLSSRSRGPSGEADPAQGGSGEGTRNSGTRKRSESRSRDDKKEGEGNQSLQDEITSVLTKLASSKIKLEKHDLTKKRTCTLGLHGPWGESSSVFVRVTFTFPRNYPQSSGPDGTPIVELERSPLISMKARAQILRRLRAIRERQRPCLEACLKFLLFASEDQEANTPLRHDSESSSDDEDPVARKARDFTVSLLRNNKNLAEPRTSQGSFGPNGELVCFFRAPPRIVRNVLRSLSKSPVKAPEPPQAQVTEETPVLQSPSLLSDAVRHLTLAASDRVSKQADARRSGTGEPMLRIMTNLLTFSANRQRRGSGSVPVEEGPKNYAMVPRRSTVFIMNTTNIAGGDKKVAVDYIFQSHSLADVCDRNALAAKEHGRYDHERVFKALGALFPSPQKGVWADPLWWGDNASTSLVRQVIDRLFIDFRNAKDVQMLAMISVILLQAWHSSSPTLGQTRTPSTRAMPSTALSSATPRPGVNDYFSMRPINRRASPVSPAWPRLPSSPTAPPPSGPSLSSSNSSRGSWSSLFTTGSMRQFMSGVQDSLKEGLATPEISPFSATVATNLVGQGDRMVPGLDSPIARRRGYRRNPSQQFPAIISKSWNEVLPSPTTRPILSFSSAGHRRPTISRMNSSLQASHVRGILVFEDPGTLDTSLDLFRTDEIDQFVRHVHIYAEILFSWQLYHKRLELLKAIHGKDAGDSTQYGIGLVRKCPRCNMVLLQKGNACPSCGNPSSMPSCTVCRLPVKGLSRSCIKCLHVTHISCWKTSNASVCSSGCGCACSAFDIGQNRDSARLVLSPLSNASVSLSSNA